MVLVSMVHNYRKEVISNQISIRPLFEIEKNSLLRLVPRNVSQGGRFSLSMPSPSFSLAIYI